MLQRFCIFPQFKIKGGRIDFLYSPFNCLMNLSHVQLKRVVNFTKSIVGKVSLIFLEKSLI